MSNICEHELSQPDPSKPDYSLVEYDLYADTGLSLRKNIKQKKYELFEINTGIVKYSYETLKEAVEKANELEGGKHTTIECGWLCPERNKI
jgi:hypothetical protein